MPALQSAPRRGTSTKKSSTAKAIQAGGFSRMSAADFLIAFPQGVTTGRSPGRKVMPPEERLQRDCFDWVFRHEAVYRSLRWLFHVPNGGARSKGEAGKLKGMGVRKGVVDVLQPFPGPGAPGLAIELKAPGQPLTSDQAEFLEEARLAGWVQGVCTTLMEFQRLVRRYLGIPDHVRMS